MMCYVTYATPYLVQPLVMISFVLQNGQSPLYTASRNGHLEVMKTLIEAGANINQANKVGTCRCTQCNCVCNYSTAWPTVYRI